jgi:hypothetical protein
LTPEDGEYYLNNDNWRSALRVDENFFFFLRAEHEKNAKRRKKTREVKRKGEAFPHFTSAMRIFTLNIYET